MFHCYHHAQLGLHYADEIQHRDGSGLVPRTTSAGPGISHQSSGYEIYISTVDTLYTNMKSACIYLFQLTLANNVTKDFSELHSGTTPKGLLSRHFLSYIILISPQSSHKSYLIALFSLPRNALPTEQNQLGLEM